MAEWCREGRQSGGMVPEREAEWRKGAGNGGTVMGGCRKWRHGGGGMPESEAWYVPDTAGGCRKARLGVCRTQREDAGKRGLVGAGHKH